MKEQNLSFILEKANSLKFEDRPIPSLKSPHDVLVNIKFTGICGSDLHFWLDGAIGHYVVKAPMVLGHESSGVVAAVGDAVTTLEIGDRVCLEPGVPCRRCGRCKGGKYNLCPDMAFAATPPIDGTLAKYYSLPADFCYKLGDTVSLEEGALMEPLSVAVHVARQASIKPGDFVVIFGAGPIGLLCGAVARAHGASKVVSVDINENRLIFARKYSATHTVISQRESAPDAAARIISAAQLGDGADVIIDATGAEACIQTAIHTLRNGGSYVQGGMGKPDVTFPILAVCTKELKLSGSFRYGPGDYEMAISLLTTGRVSVKELITGKVKFRNAEQAFHDVHEAKGIKTLIEGMDDGEVTAANFDIVSVPTELVPK